MALNLKRLALALVFCTATVGITACFEKKESEKAQEESDAEKARKLRIDNAALKRENDEKEKAAKTEEAAKKDAAIQEAFNQTGYTKIKFLHGGRLSWEDGKGVQNGGVFGQCFRLQKNSDKSFRDGCVTDSEPREVFAIKMTDEEKQRQFLLAEGFIKLQDTYKARINALGQPMDSGISAECMVLEKTADKTVHTGCVTASPDMALSALKPLAPGLTLTRQQKPE